MARTFHHGEKWRKTRHDNWAINEPKWWRKVMKHSKRRSACRELQARAVRGEEGLIWPLDSKPWVYYW